MLSNYLITRRGFYTEAFTNRTFCTEKPLHGTFTPTHTEAFTRTNFCKEKSVHKHAACTETLLHSEILRTQTNWHRSCYTQDTFKHKRDYTEKSLQRGAFTHTDTFTQRKLLHRKDFTQGIQKFGHRNAFTRRSSYTQPLGPASTSVLKGVCSIQKPLAKNQEPQSQESMEKVFGTNC